MNSKTVFLTYNLILILSLVGISFKFIEPVGVATTWTVDDDGPADFNTIQEAINNANGGDIILVRNGTYSGPLVIDKALTLEGENRDSTIVDGGSNEPSGSVVLILADNVKIIQFTIQHCRSGGNAIWLDNYVNATISNNIITNNSDGIRILHSSGNIISSNIIRNNPYNTGLGFNWAHNNIVYGNIIENNNIGIGGKYWNNIFFENIIRENIGGWAGWGISDDFYDCIFFHNNIIDNGHQVINSYPNPNVWDDNYPSGGNYWSDFSGVDGYNGPSQDVLGSDGISDTPHVINGNNQDNYPLMNPWTPIETSIKVKGNDYPVTTVSNTTIDQIVATSNTLHFKSSGPSGETGYIRVIFPMVNTTEIKVFIDGGPPLTPPPFPAITSNGTHYFIYFEFTLSSHNMGIQFAPLAVPVGGVWVPINKSKVLAPWIAMALIVVAASVVYVKRRKKKHED